MAAAVVYFQRLGSTLYYGDAEAHLDIARRIVDSKTPGWSQVGTTWLPLPHLLMLPFVRDMELWTTGLAGAIPSAICMTLAATFLFASARLLFESNLAAAAATAVFLLNPNTLYLGSIPMTEPVFFACLFALLYGTVVFAKSKSWWSLLLAALAALAGSLTRYEAWFLMPFIALLILFRGGGKRWVAVIAFCLIAGAGPALWLLHNRWYFGDPLYFYRGPYSALAIQGKTTYPGQHNWLVAGHYFLEAARLVAGSPALAIGAAGILLALWKKAFWPVLLLALPPLFYVWSIHSSGVPIFVPTLWPNSFYNTRYGLALLPLAALGAGAVARFGKLPALAVVLLSFTPVLLHPRDHSITWQESDVNSRTRRLWTAEAARYLRKAAGPQSDFFTSFGELSGIYRSARIPLRQTLTGDNDLWWSGAMARPEMFLHEDWAVVIGGDDVQTLIDRMRLHGPRFELERRITVKNAPVIEIYRRIYDNPVL